MKGTKGDPRRVTYKDIVSTFGVSRPMNDAQINSIKVPKVSTQSISCSGDVYITGVVQTPLKLAYAMSFPDGNPAAPGINFSSDLTSGIYRTPSAVGLTHNGVSVAEFGNNLSINGPISTPSGDLILNPTGNNIDFSGKNLVNFGTIVANPNRFDVVGTTVTTTDNTPVSALNITLDNAGYLCQLDVVGSSDIQVSVYFSVILSITNYPTAVIPNYKILKKIEDIPAGLTGADISIMSNHNQIQIMVTGTSNTIKWLAGCTLTRQLF